MHIRSLYASKERDGLKPASVRQIHTALSAALSEAVRLDVLDINPASKARPPKARHEELVPLSPNEARAFLDAARGAPLEALIVLAITCSLRMGEALGLRWGE